MSGQRTSQMKKIGKDEFVSLFAETLLEMHQERALKKIELVDEAARLDKIAEVVAKRVAFRIIKENLE